MHPQDEPTRTRAANAVTAERSHERDVAAARRAAATFGGDYRPGSAQRAVRRFVVRYGWRAYALPLLVVVTVLALLTMGNSTTDHHAPRKTTTAAADSPVVTQPPAAGGNTTLKSDAPSANSNETALKAAALPSGAPFTKAGKGTFRVLKGTTKVIGTKGKLYRYDVEVENGITGLDLNQFASLVDSTLADPRSWSGHGVRLQRVDSGPVDFHVSMTSMMTVRQLCGYDIHIETSCYVPAGDTTPVNRVVIDDARWVRGAAAYIGDITAYREYLINHEDGHALGHEHAHQCLADGLAPAMMQQTIGLVDAKSGAMCQANPWPYPPGAKDAPGTEAADTAQNSEFQIGGD